jgi:hypothetical protein
MASVTNPALTVSGGVCTWTATNPTNSTDLLVQIYRVSDGVEIKTQVKITSSTVTVSFNSNSNIAAGTYRAVLIGHK